MLCRHRIAFDLDETLGCPVIDRNGTIVDFSWRYGASALLERLHHHYELVLWTVSPRRYAVQALSFAPFAKLFTEVLTWDELASDPKDIRKANVALLVDDSAHHRNAVPKSLAHRYVIVPAVGSARDRAQPELWIRIVEDALKHHG
ncbi:MAG: NIF family HAD-type phosphatase [Myxococcota bacterium]